MKVTQRPRIIFIGGSNLSFGLNSQMIKDSLGLNPVNSAIHASLGLKYMLRNAVKYIKSGDIIVVSFEYHQFLGNMADGEIELLSMVSDVSPDTRPLLDAGQYFHLMKFLPKFLLSKTNPIIYFSKTDTIIDIYDRLAFNKYGDAVRHWSLSRRDFNTVTLNDDLNDEAFMALIEFKKEVEIKKAKLLITFPCFQDLSFKKSIRKIKKIERRLKDDQFTLLGNPEKYEFPDSLFFDTTYHLTKEGAILRTKLLIDDLKEIITKKVGCN
ncbi:MAG TPA: hypothetical protein VK541_00265 [Pedobacter sp.]|nr:hypothetical protein [Pedobacter sp.]